MHAELPVLSFVCVVLLSAFIPTKRGRTNVAGLSISVWLIICNLIHGANTIVWAGNTGDHAPVWCDIATKLLLGALIAVPGACLCISLNLESVASKRPISFDANALRRRKMIEYGLCYILPLIYMLWHLIVQDHRFDLVQDYGCSASIHPSFPGIILVQLPPLLICCISFVFSGIALINSSRTNSETFSLYISSRSSLTLSNFYCRVAMTLLMNTGLLSILIASIAVIHPLQLWGSWTEVHAHFGDIAVIRARDSFYAIPTWWGLFSLSVLYVLLSFTLGEKGKTLYKRLKKHLGRKDKSSNTILLPLQKGQSEGVTHSMRTHQRPLTVELKSGWDDMMDFKSPKRTRSGNSKKSQELSLLHRGSPSPNLTSAAEDDIFMESTLSYLKSPTAQTLGLANPPISPPNIYKPPAKAGVEQSAYPDHTNRSTSPRLVRPEANGTLSAVLKAPWPVPPSSPAPSVDPLLSPSRCHSPSSSVDSTFAYPLRPVVTPPHLRNRPFEGSNVTIPLDSSTFTESGSQRAVPKCPSLRSLQRSWSRESNVLDFVPGEVVRMTVVTEVV